MKVNELRIGNYYDHNGEIKKVTPNTIIEVWEVQRSWCKPIPLTEEIVTEIISRNNLGFVMEYDRDEMCYYCVFCECFDGGGYRTKVKFIHQLQNLYHSLYDEELIIDRKTVKTKQK